MNQRGELYDILALHQSSQIIVNRKFVRFSNVILPITGLVTYEKERKGKGLLVVIILYWLGFMGGQLLILRS